MIDIKGYTTIDFTPTALESGTAYFPVIDDLVDKKFCSAEFLPLSIAAGHSGLINKVGFFDSFFLNLSDQSGEFFVTDAPLIFFSAYSYGVTLFEPRKINFKQSFIRWYDELATSTAISLKLGFI